MERESGGLISLFLMRRGEGERRIGDKGLEERKGRGRRKGRKPVAGKGEGRGKGGRKAEIYTIPFPIRDYPKDKHRCIQRLTRSFRFPEHICADGVESAE
jgi:hypothetical protein